MASIIYVQFESADQTNIKAVFWAPQDPDVWPGVVQLEDDDERYLEFLNPTPTFEQVLASARVKRDRLVSYATLKINPLQDAVDIDEATGEDLVLLNGWKKYRSDLGKAEGRPGWPESTQWPSPPVPLEGLDASITETI